MSFLGLPPSAALSCIVFSFPLRFSCAAAKLSNITIDDSGKDPVTGALIQYLPNSSFGMVLQRLVTHAQRIRIQHKHSMALDMILPLIRL